MQKLIKKIIPYFFLLIIIAGVFAPSMASIANAQTGQSTLGDCTLIDDSLIEHSAGKMTFDQCKAKGKNPADTYWKADTPPDPSKSDFENKIDSGCGVNPLYWSFKGCLLMLVYYIAFLLPSFMLWLSAQFFNVMISLGIDSKITSESQFIPAAWAVVRDISNMGFILILLYIAIETILGIGHDAKKMITQVIIIALIINFSMFFTKIVIDSSNILALVFYNTLNTSTKNDNGEPRPSESGKDVSGEMYRKFNVLNLLNPETLTALGTSQAKDSGGKVVTVTEQNLPLGLTLGMMFLASLIMLYAAYTLFVAGLSFLGRMMELWVLIIFSPFAFLSSIVPQLSGVDYLGWKSWFQRLISTAFMAPIFMFFMYLIFKLIQFFPPITAGSGVISKILQMLIPALIILGLLHRAIKFAEKGAGEFGKVIITTGKAALGAATAIGVGVATGGVSAAMQGTLGHWGKDMSESGTLKDWETGKAGKFKKFVGTKLRTIGGGNDGKGGMAAASFDIRTGVVGAGLGAISKITGVDMGQSSKIGHREAGGYLADLKRRDETRKKRAEGLEVSENEDEKQNLNKLNDEKQTLSLKYHDDIEKNKKAIEAAEAKRSRFEKELSLLNKSEEPKDSDKFIAAKENANKANDDLNKLYKAKGEIKNGGAIMETVKDPVTGEETQRVKVYRTDNGLISEAVLNNQAEEANKKVTTAQQAVQTASKAEAEAVESLKKITKTAEETMKAEMAAAEAIKNKTSESIDPAKTAVEAAKIAADKAKQDADTEEKRAGTSLAPADIAAREAARDKAKKASDEASKAQKLLDDAIQASDKAKNDFETLKANADITKKKEVIEATTAVTKTQAAISAANAEVVSLTENEKQVRASIFKQI
ncbi:MAG: hypothetical protein WCI76_01545, partial [bacterium]